EVAGGIAAEQNVGTATGHVGGDSNGPAAASLGDDIRLTLVVFGIEHTVLDTLLIEQIGEELGGLNRGGTNQHRLAPIMSLLNLLDDRVELGILGAVNQVRGILADHRLIRRD